MSACALWKSNIAMENPLQIGGLMRKSTINVKCPLPCLIAIVCVHVYIYIYVLLYDICIYIYMYIVI